VLSGSQLEVSVLMLQVRNVGSCTVVVVVFAPVECDDGSKVAMVPSQQVSIAALLLLQSGAEHIAVVKLGECHEMGTRGDRSLGQVWVGIVANGSG
jgi:nicotinic acid phosphoribosyltransferase